MKPRPMTIVPPKKRGRPALPMHEKKWNYVHINVTAEQHDGFYRLLGADWLRDQIALALAKERKRCEEVTLALHSRPSREP